MTSHWDAETYLWSFQLCFIRNNPRDLNLGRWEARNRNRGQQLGLSWQQRACHIFNVYDLYRRCPPRQFDALLARLHQQSMLIFATIALVHPKSALEPFQWLAVRSFEWLFLAGILESSLDCFAIFCHNVINNWSRVSKEPNYFRCWAPSAKAFDDRGFSIILRIWFQHRSHLENDYLLKTSGFLGCQQQPLAEAQYSGKFKLKFVRILMTHLEYHPHDLQGNTN